MKQINLLIFKNLKITLGIFLGSFLANNLSARPLLTEPFNTVGHLNFDSGFSISERTDKFGSPEQEYETTQFPFHAILGLGQHFDFGLDLIHYTHRLKSGDTNLKGSSTGIVAPRIKWTFNDYIGVHSQVEIDKSENTSDDFPLANGTNASINFLFKVPLSIPSHFNVGYVHKGSYKTRNGVETSIPTKIKPGSYYRTSVSLEFPLGRGVSILTEGAYFLIDKTELNGLDLQNSDGEALDGLVGLTWSRYGWDIGLGAAFGLLDESHTSFDIKHGAGDVTYTFSLAYRLIPRRPQE